MPYDSNTIQKMAGILPVLLAGFTKNPDTVRNTINAREAGRANSKEMEKMERLFSFGRGVVALGENPEPQQLVELAATHGIDPRDAMGLLSEFVRFRNERGAEKKTAAEQDWRSRYPGNVAGIPTAAPGAQTVNPLQAWIAEGIRGGHMGIPKVPEDRFSSSAKLGIYNTRTGDIKHGIPEKPRDDFHGRVFVTGQDDDPWGIGASLTPGTKYQIGPKRKITVVEKAPKEPEQDDVWIHKGGVKRPVSPEQAEGLIASEGWKRGLPYTDSAATEERMAKRQELISVRQDKASLKREIQRIRSLPNLQYYQSQKSRLPVLEDELNDLRRREAELLGRVETQLEEAPQPAVNNGPGPAMLPAGLDEETINYNMQKYGKTREEVIQKYLDMKGGQ